MSGYQPKDIEKKWQDAWEKEGLYHAKDLSPSEKQKKFYGLIEFPYPSGEGLHVGHPRSYTAIDIVTRKKRMEGKNVLYPIGWDAFGLPTENFAIKHKVKPRDATAKNVANFKRQLKSLGFGFDWSREINTTDPEYYRWTQWMFLQFFNATYDEKTKCARRATGDEPRMAYKATTLINWCPSCKIGLANEEAQGGVCERCGSKVEKREKAQWMIRITAYADRLLEDLNTVDYLDRIKTQQMNWIGKSEGAYVDFQVLGPPSSVLGQDEGPRQVKVFTTRPDTMFGATFLVISPELAQTWIDVGWKASEEVRGYVTEGLKGRGAEGQEGKEEKEKSGVASGIHAMNPATGETIPVWISSYVLGNVGTGAIMAVPAHDERDDAFARAFNIPRRQVVFPGETRDLTTVKTCLETLKEIVPLFEKEKIDAYLEGGLALAFQNGMAYRAANDIDLVTVDATDTKRAADLLKAHGWEIMRRPEKIIATKSGKANVELVPPKGLAFDGRHFTSMNVEAEPRMLWGVFAKTITVEYQRAMKEWQAKNRDKKTDAVDIAWFGRTSFTEDGIAVNSGFLDGLSTKDAKEKMIAWLEKNEKGTRAITYRLRDWVFSRQRYWGEPIPIIFCERCGTLPVPEQQLPVLLPDVDAYEPTDTGESPLAAMSDWVNIPCWKCGGRAKRETDTMPNWAGSSWYFLRYCDPHNTREFASPEKLKFWMPVDLYNGGMEHTTLHLLYSRFWYKFLWDLDHVPKECGSEPYSVRRSHALILGEGGVKMSKSKGNVVNPDDVVLKYGADVFRLYEMFIGPFDADAPWDTNGIEGIRRFLEKVWKLFSVIPAKAGIQLDAATETLLHQTIKKVGDDIETLNFNTAVSAMMILANAMHGPSEDFLKLLAPFAPHIAEELWRARGHETSIHLEPWPTYDPAKLVSDTFELVVQVNGKVRDRFSVATNMSEEDAKQKALASEKVQAFLDGKTPQKVIYVKGRLVSISL